MILSVEDQSKMRQKMSENWHIIDRVFTVLSYLLLWYRFTMKYAFINIKWDRELKIADGDSIGKIACI